MKQIAILLIISGTLTAGYVLHKNYSLSPTFKSELGRKLHRGPDGCTNPNPHPIGTMEEAVLEEYLDYCEGDRDFFKSFDQDFADCAPQQSEAKSCQTQKTRDIYKEYQKRYNQLATKLGLPTKQIPLAKY
jgi:hypothetical protein